MNQPAQHPSSQYPQFEVIEFNQVRLFRATVYCRDDAGDQYRESREAETQQAATANDLAPFRMRMLADARAAVNARHVVAEGFEMGVM